MVTQPPTTARDEAAATPSVPTPPVEAEATRAVPPEAASAASAVPTSERGTMGAAPVAAPVAGQPPPEAGAGLSWAPDAAPAQGAGGSPPAAPDPWAAQGWPPSTRLSYTLSGNFRGPVEGSAQVEWVREGPHYQMHLDVVVGPRFAPLVSRRLSSDGLIGAQGLVPSRYDEETGRAFAASRLLTLHFEPDGVLLANGRRVARPTEVQDSASQFGQLAWLLGREPGRLVVGGQIELELALPRRVDRWTYDVSARETVYAPFGPVETFRLRPRPLDRPAGELAAQMWIAPSLQYLPVRIRIEQDAETYVDLVIDRAPLQAAAR